MVIVVATGEVRVDEAEDLKRFHVEAPAGADVDAALRAAAFGHLDESGDDAWVSVEAVRSAVSGSVEASTWGQAFDGMLGYARSKGWLDDSGALIRAHVERT